MVQGRNQRTTIGWVYFIQCRTGPIKIGWAVDVEARRRDLQIGCPDELRVLASIAAPPDLERELHQRFATHRYRGEWFWPDQILLDFIRSIPNHSPTRFNPNSYSMTRQRHSSKANRNTVRRFIHGSFSGPQPDAS